MGALPPVAPHPPGPGPPRAEAATTACSQPCTPWVPHHSPYLSLCPSSDGHAAETAGSCQLHRVSRQREHPGPQPPGHTLRAQWRVTGQQGGRTVPCHPLFPAPSQRGLSSPRTGGAVEEGAGSWCCTLANSLWDWQVDLHPQTRLLVFSGDFGRRSWLFFLDFLSQLQTPGLSGEGFRRHQTSLR